MNNSHIQICPLCSGPGRFFYANEEQNWRYFQCDDCGFTWRATESHPSLATERSHYSNHTNDPSDASYREFLSRLWHPLRASLPSGAKGLDYGSGPGPTLHLMAREDGFVCDHFDPFFYPDESVLLEQYDFITCSETAEHFHKPAAEFRKLFSLLKEGGVLGIMTSLLQSPSEFKNWHYPKDPTHVSFYTPQSFEAIQQVFGFRSIHFPSKNIILLRR